MITEKLMPAPTPALIRASSKQFYFTNGSEVTPPMVPSRRIV